ncbi:hypothetical protein K503DRAFT_240385 [Rhizopogon vinicolor AM-OR11-026]|uniref:Uncharacterized protein n=1 Tax=Rhizopogon vinicolor AM-OR11-026 TaxID=1314800 RepID=A0A1B7MXH7_9AGAM|nr:hypothetical protein K503DRAFT_240385 [Rhizopogon vinicolor AM-OR11-026]
MRHSSTASPRDSDAPITIHVSRLPDHALWSGPETNSLACSIKQQRQPMVVNARCPFCKSQTRKSTSFYLLNVHYIIQRTSAAEARNASAGNSRTPRSSVTAIRAAQAQPSSELHAAVATSSTTPALCRYLHNTATRFWPDICCCICSIYRRPS